MLVALALVELVRACADHIGTEMQRAAALLARPLLRLLEYPLPRAKAALPFGNDQPVQLRADVVLDQMVHAHVTPADYLACRRFRHKHRMQRRGLEAAHPAKNILCRGRITELPGELGNLRGIGFLRQANVSSCRTQRRAHLAYLR